MKSYYLGVLLLLASRSLLASPPRDTTIEGGTRHKGWVFPEKKWETHDPETFGIRRGTLDSIDRLMQKAHANGALIKNGYLVAEWHYDGPKHKQFEVQSITKSITSMLLGIALNTGKIAHITDRVKDYYPDFNGGPYTDQITFWHLVTNTSGIKARHWAGNYIDPDNRPPGIASQYHNDHIGELSGALTYIFKALLIEVLRNQVLSVTGGKAGWGTDDVTIQLANGHTIKRNAGYAFSKWSAADLARIGWLYMNEGNWAGRQLLPADYVRASLTPLQVPVMQYRRPPQPPVDTTHMTYGYGWRGLYTASGNLQWYMSGNGGQFCLILPKAGIVFTKVNGYSKPYKPYIGLGGFEPFVQALIGQVSRESAKNAAVIKDKSFTKN